MTSVSILHDDLRMNGCDCFVMMRESEFVTPPPTVIYSF